MVAVLFGSCKANGSAGSIEFETLQGVISKHVTNLDVTYDSIKIEYDLVWPVGGDEKVVSYVKGWIVEQITGERYANTNNLEIKEILNSMADKMASDASSWTKNIQISANENTPFESYLTLAFFEEGEEYMANHTDYRDASLSIRLSDGKVFDAQNAMSITPISGELIERYIHSEYIKENSEKEWQENIKSYLPDVLPMPLTPLRLTKEGIAISYMPGELVPSVYSGLSCVLPYDKAKDILSAEAKEFLFGNEETGGKEEVPEVSAPVEPKRTPFSMTLTGKVGGKYPIQMHLEGYKTNEGIYPESGKYCYTKYMGAWINLKFEINKPSDFIMYAYTDGKLTGTWDVYFDENKHMLIGYLTNYKDETFPVELKAEYN